MKEIGGYLEMELGAGGPGYHTDVVGLNSGRNALEYILRLRGYDKLYLPHYHCDALIVPLKRLEIDYEFYSIDYNFEFTPFEVPQGAGLLYINFFGLKDEYVAGLAQQYASLIVDNAHSFYSAPIAGVDTFYSCRKFFGVPDGAYVAATDRLQHQFAHDVSAHRYQHLVGRRDQSANEHFSFYRQVEDSFDTEEIKLMSGSTAAVMGAIDYDRALSRRRANYSTLHAALKQMNRLKLPDVAAGLSYPLLASRDIMQRLISHKIYIGTYWPNVIADMPHHTTEYDLAYNLISLPIDQRYDASDMAEIIKRVIND